MLFLRKDLGDSDWDVGLVVVKGESVSFAFSGGLSLLLDYHSNFNNDDSFTHFQILFQLKCVVCLVFMQEIIIAYLAAFLSVSENQMYDLPN